MNRLALESQATNNKGDQYRSDEEVVNHPWPPNLGVLVVSVGVLGTGINRRSTAMGFHDFEHIAV